MVAGQHCDVEDRLGGQLEFRLDKRKKPGSEKKAKSEFESRGWSCGWRVCTTGCSYTRSAVSGLVMEAFGGGSGRGQVASGGVFS